MIVGIDPKIDYAFKHLFGREATRPILIDLVDKVLNPAPGHHILDIELLNPFNPKEALDDKLSILDIKARDQSGRQFNVEMQMLSVPDYEKRIVYYSCKLHQQQLHEGEAHILELPKFTTSAAELTSGLDVWLYFLRNAAMMDIDALPAAMREPLVVRALEELKMLTQTDLERERYESRRKAQLDEQSRLKGAHREGHEEGRREGRQEGRTEGVQIGIIHFCERLLARPETATSQLEALSLDELTRMAEDLQQQVVKQK